VATNNKALVGDLPIILSQSIPTALVKYKREDFAASYAIGNTPWLSAASDQNRISRITTTYQKERIDQGSSAGENSLSNWWFRSATSWHHGSGERYYDADASDLYRYYESNNIDVWSVGELSLLKATTSLSTAAASSPVTVAGGTFYLENSTLKFYNESTSTSTSIALPGVGNIPYCITSDGTYCIVAATEGIYDVTTAGVIRILWDKPTYVAAAWFPQAIAYVKERIIVAAREGTVEVGIYEASRAYVTPTPRLNASNERWETANTATVVNSIAELNSAIIAGYTQGAVSRVLSFTIDPTNPLAAINEPTVIAELPRGESLNQIRCYLSEYVALATTRGLRIGNQSSDGNAFTYGSLNVEGEVKDIAFSNSYIYATRAHAYNNTYGLWRINLGTPLDGHFAYAADLVTDSGTVNGVAFIGTSDRKFITSSSGVWIEHATSLATSGTISSGYIRWGTSERKQPVSIAIRAVGSDGQIGFTVSDDNGNASSIGAVPLNASTDLQLSAGLQPSDNFEITMTLTRSTSDVTLGPTLQEWQCRALPAPIRSRTITVPLLCYEEERDPNGVTNVSNPWERIKYLERIEQNGGAVLYQDFSSEEERICVIRAIQFEQQSPPSFASGFGGIVTVQLQTIDTEQPIQ
jgi:hypothetical protein